METVSTFACDLRTSVEGGMKTKVANTALPLNRVAAPNQVWGLYQAPPRVAIELGVGLHTRWWFKSRCVLTRTRHWLHGGMSTGARGSHGVHS